MAAMPMPPMGDATTGPGPGMPALPPPPGAGGPSAPGAPGPGGPVSAPMSQPSPMPGVQKAARVQVQVASEMIQRELPHFPLDSEEFKALTSALNAITKVFGKSADEDRKLFPAEIMNMLGAIGPKSAPPGVQAMGGPPAPPGAPPMGAPA